MIQFTRHPLTMPALLITAFLSTEAGSAQGCFALIAINARSCSSPSLPSFLLSFLRFFLFTLGSKVWQLETAARSHRGETAAVGGEERHRNPPLNKLARKNNGNNFHNTSGGASGPFLSGGGVAWRGSQSEFRKNFRNELDFL